jgi:hypothetical protein
LKPEAEGHAPPRGGPPDPLEVAEALRDALADSAAKASRLVSVLRHSSQQKKALQTVLSSLKQLTLGTEEPR